MSFSLPPDLALPAEPQDLRLGDLADADLVRQAENALDWVQTGGPAQASVALAHLLVPRLC